MATLTCPNHGPQPGSVCGMAGCMLPLRPEAPPAPGPPPTLCAEPGCGSPLDAGGTCPVHSLGGLADEAAVRAPGPAPAPGGLGLVFPWGATVPVGADGIRVGRSDDAGSLAAHLDAYDSVSRHHAEIRSDGARVLVRDLGSTNGTFVNDHRLDPYTDREVRSGDVLRFASTLSVRVRELR